MWLSIPRDWAYISRIITKYGHDLNICSWWVMSHYQLLTHLRATVEGKIETRNAAQSPRILRFNDTKLSELISEVLLSCLVVLLTIINFSFVTPIDGSTCTTPSPNNAKLQNVNTFLNSNQIHSPSCDSIVLWGDGEKISLRWQDIYCRIISD